MPRHTGSTPCAHSPAGKDRPRHRPVPALLSLAPMRKHTTLPTSRVGPRGATCPDGGVGRNAPLYGAKKTLAGFGLRLINLEKRCLPAVTGSRGTETGRRLWTEMETSRIDWAMTDHQESDEKFIPPENISRARPRSIRWQVITVCSAIFWLDFVARRSVTVRVRKCCAVPPCCSWLSGMVRFKIY